MSRPFRILQLNSARKYIGEAAHTLNLTEALRRRGHSVWMGLRKGFDTFERASARQLEPIPFNMPHRWWPPQDVPDIRKIAKLVSENKIDLIHTHRGKDHWQAIIANKLYRLRVPVIRTRHVVTPLSANAANRWLAKRTAALVVVSQAVEKDVRGTGIYSGERLVFIPGGIDMDLFTPATADRKVQARLTYNLPADAPIAACVARFAVVKAHRVLIAAWKRVAEKFPAARLLLIGDGQLMNECQAQRSALGLDENIIFMGRRNDIPQILDAVDFGVLSSVGSEGFSRAVLEYMAKGIPTAATKVGAVPDLIDNDVHGVLATPNDDASLAAAVLQVISASASQRDQWGRAAREKVERGYGYESWAQAHEHLYERVVNAK